MPELPDVALYLDALRDRIAGHRLVASRVRSPFLIRSVDPKLEETHGARVVALERLGKRIAIGFDNDLWIVIHLMIAGRLQWLEKPRAATSKVVALVLEFDNGHLWLTEAGTRKRASVHVVRGRADLARHDPGGIEIASATREAFRTALHRGNHTLKRALTDPRAFSGIGNAYSDEILHRARLSPVALTSRLSDEDCDRLFAAVRDVLGEWSSRLREQTGTGFPSRVTAFRGEMAVHGKYGQPCPDCGTKVQRIRYADNETNYCPRCQTGGRMLADRSLSRLLKKDWPKSIDEWEALGG
jgi:formamidopyrimidine-DNA glycosylase